MNIKLPVIKDGTKRYIDAQIDTSLYAEMKWEAEFPMLAAKESVMQYTARISNIFRSSAADAAVVLSGLKALYCFLDGAELPDFKSFVKMLSAENAETTKELIEILRLALEKIPNASAGNSKN